MGREGGRGGEGDGHSRAVGSGSSVRLGLVWTNTSSPYWRYPCTSEVKHWLEGTRGVHLLGGREREHAILYLGR